MTAAVVLGGTTVEELRDEWANADLEVAPRSYWREVGHRFLGSKMGMVAGGILVLITLSAIFAPLLAPYNPDTADPFHRLAAVGSPGHLLGTDDLGRDMLSRLLYGGRISLLDGFVPVVGATIVGTALGMWAGLSKFVANNIIMRTMDMLYAFPAILLAIAVSTSLGPGISNAMIATTIIFIPPICRIAQSATRSIMPQEYVEAAQLSGAGPVTLLRSQILPNVVNPVLAYATGLLGISMIIAASLSFLGLGAQPPAPEWGFMLQSLRGQIYDAAVVSALPGAMIFITSIAFNMFADAFREAMDVRAA
jgi:peptide/nickel transport system permease protein